MTAKPKFWEIIRKKVWPWLRDLIIMLLAGNEGSQL